MDSDGSISRLQLSLMPTLAILTHELSGLVSSWLVRLWLIAAAIGTFLVVAGNWTRMESAPLIASVLFSLPGISLVPRRDRAGHQSGDRFAIGCAGRRHPESPGDPPMSTCLRRGWLACWWCWPCSLR